MAELGVGRTPMREAVKRLESERMLTVYPRRGTIVTDVNIRDLKAISDARRVLEAFAARRAATLATEADRQRLQECRDALRRSHAETDQVSMQLDERIHHTLYEIMRNSYVEATLIQYFSLAQRMWNFVLAGMAPIDAHIREHDDLIQAVMKGDADRAARLAEEHVTHFEQRVRDAL